MNFDKIENRLPGFKCTWTLRDGAEELKSVSEQIDLDKATFEFRAFTRLKQLNYLISTGQIDDRFFWNY